MNGAMSKGRDKMEMSVEMAVDLGLIPEIEPYVQTGRFLCFKKIRSLTWDEYHVLQREAYKKYGFNEKTYTVFVDRPNL